MTYVLLTRAPVVLLPLDLHVLSMPPAFVLSQDQTLRCRSVCLSFLCCASGLTAFGGCCLDLGYSLIVVLTEEVSTDDVGVPKYPSAIRDLTSSSPAAFAPPGRNPSVPLCWTSPRVSSQGVRLLPVVKEHRKKQGRTGGSTLLPCARRVCKGDKSMGF